MGDSSVPCPMIDERVACLHGKNGPDYLLPISIYNKIIQKIKIHHIWVANGIQIDVRHSGIILHSLNSPLFVKQ